MFEYFVPFCVIFFVIVTLGCTYIMIKGIIYDWEFFKPILLWMVQGIILGCTIIIFMTGAVNLPDYVSKWLEFLK